MSDYRPTPTPPPSAPYATVRQPGQYNVLAIVGFVLAFVVPIGGIICGHIALAQIKRTGESGHGLALAGTILGYAFVALFIVVFLAAIFIPLMLGLAGSSY